MSDDHADATDEHDTAHQRPPGVPDDIVEAVGKLSEALEWIERARGRLYDFHQLVGRADFLLSDAAELLSDAGETELAERLRVEAIGRNVLPGRWTFQVVDEFADTYYDPVKVLEDDVRQALLQGRRHVYESELKEQRRTAGRPAHESRPGDAAE